MADLKDNMYKPKQENIEKLKAYLEKHDFKINYIKKVKDDSK